MIAEQDLSLERTLQAVFISANPLLTQKLSGQPIANSGKNRRIKTVLLLILTIPQKVLARADKVIK